MIVALTASAFEHEREQILACGANDFVAKPFRAEVLFAKLEEHLGVSYRYDTDEAGRAVEDASGDALTPERLGRIPAEQLRKLYDLLSIGDFEEATGVAESIQTLDDGLGRALLSEIKAFQFDRLLQLLEAI
jgi:CheY-like chemotaxis protein